MQHFRSLEGVAIARSWATIGVFDGVHLGHRKIIERVVRGAHAGGLPAVAVTFWPHPAAVLGHGAPGYLSTAEERAQLLGELGIDLVITLPFNQHLASTEAHDFVAILKKHLGLTNLIIGYDFALGHSREGTVSRLEQLGTDLQYEVEVIPALHAGDTLISSTEARRRVMIGDAAGAAQLLGRNYSLHGEVVHGDGRGRQLGFPTANVQPAEDKILPANGVYACWAHLDGARHPAAVNVGTRPQFHARATRPLVEAYLLDFDADLYGCDLRIEFVARLRAETKFDSVQVLIEQMHLDVKEVRVLLN